MSKMWEVDPETRAKLVQISKTNGNDRCCDCGAPSPQWASPKFGTFICLNCAGTHRGLGVHISFVRSITMDAFKISEIQRMEKGGNEPWKTFFDDHVITQSEGRTFEDSTIKERYEGDVGDEYKERLSATIEGREYVPGQKPPPQPKKSAVAEPASRSGTPLGRASPASLDGGKKERNEAYFAKMGAENASRSDSVPPSLGGKYTGFGGGLPASSERGGGTTGNAPGLDEFQKDPMAALTRGFGWFATAVGKGAKTVNDSYIQPTAKTISQSDLAAQARIHATTLGQNIQTGARGAAGQFQRFVEGPDHSTNSNSNTNNSTAGSTRGNDPDRKDFWDDFATLAAQDSRRNVSVNRSGAIGTAAMKNGPGSGSGSATASGGGSGTKTGKEKDDWGDDW